MSLLSVGYKATFPPVKLLKKLWLMSDKKGAYRTGGVAKTNLLGVSGLLRSL